MCSRNWSGFPSAASERRTAEAAVDLRVTARVTIPEREIEISAVRAGGPGGQHVNKVSSAAHLRFDIRASSLPEAWKSRLLALPDQRITSDGIVIIKAQDHRSLEMNREAALERLRSLVEGISRPPRPRIPTRPTAAAKKRRVEEKARKGRIKALRGRIRDE